MTANFCLKSTRPQLLCIVPFLQHCSAKDKGEKKLLGFSFVFLMEADETTIKDGDHVLCLYKCEDAHKIQSPGAYLNLPSKVSQVVSSDSITLSQGFVRSSKESLGNF